MDTGEFKVSSSVSRSGWRTDNRGALAGLNVSASSSPKIRGEKASYPGYAAVRLK